MTDHEGKPLWVQVFEGNTADHTTVLDQIKLLRDTLGIQELVFVGDRGMLTHAVIEDIEKEFDERKVDYITALKRQEMMELVDRQDHPIQPELFDEREICEVWDGLVRYVLCHNPDRRDRDAQVRERLLSKTEAKLQSIRDNVASGRIKRRDVIMKRLFRWLNQWKMGRFFQVDYDEARFTYQRDVDAIQRYSRLDGCYVVKSNVCVDTMDKDEVVSRYKSLKHVEQAFRTMKTTELEIRPIRHWTPSRVKGHVFMCFLAYRVIYEARQRWACELERDPITRECDGDSLQEMWAALDKITAGFLSVADEAVRQVGRVTPVQRRYLEELRVPVQIRLGRE
jgi:transposase